MHTVLRVFVYCLSLLAGAFILLALVFPQYVLPVVIHYVEALGAGGRVSVSAMWTPLCLGVILVLVPVALSLRWLSRHRFSRQIYYTTTSGRVSVNLQTIEEALTRTLVHKSQVKQAVIRMHEDRIRRRVVITAVLTLWEEIDITTTNERCQDMLTRRFSELMPNQRSVQVNVSVNRLRHRQGTAFHESLEAREASGTDSITPGLAATEGLDGNAAGRELLRKTSTIRGFEEERPARQRGDTEYGESFSDAPPKPKPLPRTEQRRQAQPPLSTLTPSTPSATTAESQHGSVNADSAGDDDNPFEDMYQGPVYAVPIDDDDDD